MSNWGFIKNLCVNSLSASVSYCFNRTIYSCIYTYQCYIYVVSICRRTSNHIESIFCNDCTPVNTRAVQLFVAWRLWNKGKPSQSAVFLCVSDACLLSNGGRWGEMALMGSKAKCPERIGVVATTWVKLRKSLCYVGRFFFFFFSSSVGGWLRLLGGWLRPAL